MNHHTRWSSCLLAVLLLAPAVAAMGQHRPSVSEITRIAHEVSLIDAELSTAPAHTKTFNWGPQSGVLSLYRAGGGASKVVVQLVSEQNGEVIECYYQDGTPIYAIVARKDFGASNPTGTGALSGTPNLEEQTPNAQAVFTAISENRYYLADGALVGWLRGRGRGPVKLSLATGDEAKFAAKSKEIIDMTAVWNAFAESSSTDFTEFQKDLP